MILPVAPRYSSIIKVTCMHGDALEVAIAHIKIVDETGEWKLTVSVVPDDLVPLLQEDWPGFLRELPTTRRVRR